VSTDRGRRPLYGSLGGRFRQKVRVYDHAAPGNMLDKVSSREWAAKVKVKADPAGFTAHKFGFPHSSPDLDLACDNANRVLTTRELMQVRLGFENCREALGWDHDIMVPCHWEYDFRTALQIAEAVESIKPLWLEDPLQVEYSEEWSKLCLAARVPICTGENLARRQGFRDFIAIASARSTAPRETESCASTRTWWLTPPVSGNPNLSWWG